MNTVGNEIIFLRYRGKLLITVNNWTLDYTQLPTFIAMLMT